MVISKRLLVVDPDLSFGQAIRQACSHLATVETCADFPGARQRLLDARADLLVTNLRLGAYNGLHLVYLSTCLDAQPRAVVYSAYFDVALAEEAQRNGAFFEMAHRVVYALPGYLTAMLPDRDRRTPRQQDRRAEFRGGRRTSDVAIVL